MSRNGSEPKSAVDPPSPASPLAEQPTGLEEVLSLVRDREGVDLCRYRRETVERRVSSRLKKLRCKSYREYLCRLADDPAEGKLLIEHVTLKVSRFFRNADVFAVLGYRVMADSLRRCARTGTGLRVWSAGCGNGEEAYSLAILADQLAEKERLECRVVVLGTDVDDTALAFARRGVYPEAALVETPSDLLEAYFLQRRGQFGNQCEVSIAIREKVQCLRHDLLSATAPAALPFHVIVCRNVLIYFDRPSQEQVFDLLAGSLAIGGYLCLGEAEQLAQGHTADFDMIDRRARVYRKVDPAARG